MLAKEDGRLVKLASHQSRLWHTTRSSKMKQMHKNHQKINTHFQDLFNKRTFKQNLHSFVKPESNPLPISVVLLEIGISQTDNSL
jgi:hypothetical protein